MPISTFFIQKNCDRCGRLLNGGRTMSFFTKETICMECSDIESEIRKKICERDGDPMGDFRYEGIGRVPKVEQ